MNHIRIIYSIAIVYNTNMTHTCIVYLMKTVPNAWIFNKKARLLMFSRESEWASSDISHQEQPQWVLDSTVQYGLSKIKSFYLLFILYPWSKVCLIWSYFSNSWKKACVRSWGGERVVRASDRGILSTITLDLHDI